MAICSCCQKDFVDIELYPRLIISKDARVARELMEEKGKEMLCLPCWLSESKKLEHEDLVMVVLGLLKKIEKNSALKDVWTTPLSESLKTSVWPINSHPAVGIGTIHTDNTTNPVCPAGSGRVSSDNANNVYASYGSIVSSSVDTKEV